MSGDSTISSISFSRDSSQSFGIHLREADEVEEGKPLADNLVQPAGQEVIGEAEQKLENLRNPQLLKQLNDLLLTASQQIKGDVSLEDLQNELSHCNIELTKPQQLHLQQLTTEIANTMEELGKMTGNTLIEALKNQDKDTLQKIDKAVLAQQELADAIRSMRFQPLNNESLNDSDALAKASHDSLVENQNYSLLLEELADKCDRRAAEITSVVVSIFDNPDFDGLLMQSESLAVDWDAVDGLRRAIPDEWLGKLWATGNDATSALREVNSYIKSLKEFRTQELKPELFERAIKAINNYSNAFLDLSDLQTDRRLAEQLRNMAEDLYRQGNALMSAFSMLPECLERAQERFQASQERTLTELLPEAAVQMHGTTAVLTHFVEKIRAPLEHLEDFERNPGERNIEEILRLGTELRTTKEKMEDIVREGSVTVNGGTTILDKELLHSLQELLDKATASLQKYYDFFACGIERKMKNLANVSEILFPTFEVEPELLHSEFFKKTFPMLAHMGELSNRLRDVEWQAMTNPDDAIRELSSLQADIQKLYETVEASDYKEEIGLFKDFPRMVKRHRDGNLKRYSVQMQNYLSLSVADQDIFLRAIAKGIKMNKPQSKQEKEKEEKDSMEIFLSRRKVYLTFSLMKMNEMLKRLSKHKDLISKYLQGSEIRKAIGRFVPLSTIIESQLNGARVDMIDETCDDTNLVSAPENLGHGRANMVYLCKYRKKDGGTVKKVFKGDLNGCLGNLDLVVVGLMGVTTLQNANLNIASLRCAKMFHAGDLFIETSVGMLKGEYGIFMDMAPGCSAAKLKTKRGVVQEGEPLEERGLSMDEILAKDLKWRTAVMGKLMRKLNKLQWMDLLMGQGDRHNGNYFVHIKDNGEVTVKAIDNDACLTPNKPGLTKVQLWEEGLERLKMEIFGGQDGSFKAFLRSLIARSAAEQNPDGSVTFDTSKMEFKGIAYLHKVTGFMSFNIPAYMDEDIYVSLMELKDERKRKELEGCLPPDLNLKAKNHFFKRLNDMIELAEKYNQPGPDQQARILKEEEWEDDKRQQEMYKENEPFLRPTLGTYYHILVDEQYRMNFFGADLFFRDFGKVLKKP